MSRWPIAAAAFLLWQAGSPHAVDPFTFLTPTVSFTAADRDRLARGSALVRVLPSDAGEVAIVAAVPVGVDPPRFVSWIRQIAALKKSAFVTGIARFSDPPVLHDLDGLTLDDEDLEAIRQCKANDCDINLAREELDLLHKAASGPGWRDALQLEFRQLVLARVRAYLAGGQRALPSYIGAPASTEAAFNTIVTHTAFLTTHLPALTRHLQDYPRTPPPSRVESFLYWSKEALGGRPTTSVTHVAIFTPDADDLPDVVVAGKQVFATHYTTGALNITALTRGPSSAGRYLVYVNRSRVDVLERWYGGLARVVIEHKIKGEAADVLQGLRHRLESGDPPSGSISGAGPATARTPAPR
ncbi:MAG: hypothetical protein ACHQO8_00740 [Vicinamibacterales bacterium]